MSNAGGKGKWAPRGLALFGMLCAGLLWMGPAFGQTPGSFAATGRMTAARYSQTATLLSNGMILIAGGYGSNGSVLSSAELYNPTTGAFTATGSMNYPRAEHTATLLQNGKVLVTGGEGSGNTAELYDPTTGQFSVTGSMNQTRYSHTATLLPNGEVLVVGGDPTVNPSAELYDPASGKFTVTGNLSYPRWGHTATLLPNGLVLIAGGTLGGTWHYPVAAAELYNPSTGTFSTTGSLNTPRFQHTATLLQSGSVLIAGGSTASSIGISSAELYNPSAGTFTYSGSLNTGRSYHTATLLNNGTVLIAGGYSGGPPFSTAELYNPATGTFIATGSMTAARYIHTATLLNNGMVLIAGGYSGSSVLSSAELYDPLGVTGYVDPKFIVVGVTYAPPGPSGSTYVSYGNSAFIGTTNSLSNSFMTGDSYSVSLSHGFGIPLVLHGSITSTYSGTSSQTTTNSSSVTMTFQTSNAETTFGTGSYWAPVNNDYDIIWVWLNPAVIVTVSNTQVVWNGYGIDETDQPGMDIVPIPLGYLNGDFGPMPSDLQASLNRSWAANQLPSGQNPAVTSADYPQIASADPFSATSYGADQIGSDPPSPETPDNRFTMSACTQQQSFNYLQAAPSQTPPIYTCTLTYTTNSTQAKQISSTSSQTFSYDQSFSGGWFATFSLDLKNSNTLTWTTQEQTSITNSTTSTASLSVQGPPCNNVYPEQGPCVPVYDSSGTEPTQFYIYQDNMWGTFMFAPVAYY